MTRTYDMPQGAKDALAADPVDYIKRWWTNHSTAEERKAAEDRGATPSGAFAFVESVARKAKHSNACLPDEVVYELAGIFLRNGADGDEFITPDELARRERADAHKRKIDAQTKAAAEKKEAERKASLTPEQRAEEERVERERAENSAKEEARRKELQAAREAKRARIERAKAIAQEMRDRQLEFNFGGQP